MPADFARTADLLLAYERAEQKYYEVCLAFKRLGELPMCSFGFTDDCFDVLYGRPDWPSHSYWIVPGTHEDDPALVSL
ncbi:hypothetical protein [Bradyrhizobium sp. Ec3.3]|uniref:hypothetical protein n=1 Tax=Bradyrhizobium sp. Ec3.3 TaxID=189753 RepID=UPI0004802102|nr:hypothetical protein [Bradyrhizobium sp. Ec3.3]